MQEPPVALETANATIQGTCAASQRPGALWATYGNVNTNHSKTDLRSLTRMSQVYLALQSGMPSKVRPCGGKTLALAVARWCAASGVAYATCCSSRCELLERLHHQRQLLAERKAVREKEDKQKAAEAFDSQEKPNQKACGTGLPRIC